MDPEDIKWRSLLLYRCEKCEAVGEHRYLNNMHGFSECDGEFVEVPLVRVDKFVEWLEAERVEPCNEDVCEDRDIGFNTALDHIRDMVKNL